MVNFGNTVYLKNTELFSAAVVASEILLINLGNLKLSFCNKIFQGLCKYLSPYQSKQYNSHQPI